ncbi:MAG: hypothetical protein ACI9Y1_003108, partial [Lentisphaeria bacterium]
LAFGPMLAVFSGRLLAHEPRPRNFQSCAENLVLLTLTLNWAGGACSCEIFRYYLVD